MIRYNYPDQALWPEITARPASTGKSPVKSVQNILRRVKKNGDKALLQYARKLDGVKLNDLHVSAGEINAAAAMLPDALKAAIRQAKNNIETFHRSQVMQEPDVKTMPGIRCWRNAVPIQRVGLYIPGGSAPLFSTVLMLGIPASIAGCREIILCSPPSRDGSIHPAILYAAQLCGITRIVKAGGAQAIAAMAYGTESIPRVMKIFGPGNQYVTLAKQLIQPEGTAIDMPAGPSEVLVIADETTRPEFAAADLLSQAEHGPDSQVLLVCTDAEIMKKIIGEVKKQLRALPRKKTAAQALKQSRAILVRNLDEALALSDNYAPEHLILSCADAAGLAGRVTAAGSVFIGPYSPESAGDYASGTNHTLPTSGYAAMYSGVSTDSFVKKITFQHLTREGLNRIAGTVMTMAEAEGLEAHKNAVQVRLIQA